MNISVLLLARNPVSGVPWLIATRNEGKIREWRALLADEGIEAMDLVEAGIGPTREEDGLEIFGTFEENALAKARFFAARAVGRVVAADDSGLEVYSLAREPGVRSRRWSGSELSGQELEAANNELLLQRLSGVTDRLARFVCAVVCSFGGDELITRGEIEGSILDKPSGAYGFGYDPYFWAPELSMTLADATIREKQNVSHRARAFRAAVARLRAHEGPGRLRDVGLRPCRGTSSSS